MKINPYIIYGGDTLPNGLCAMETMRRCDDAISFIKKHSHLQFVIILAAGYRPDKPLLGPLKGVMKVYLEEKLIEEKHHSRIEYVPDIIIAEQDGWGTFKETISAVKEVGKLGVTDIYVNSSWYHIPRVLFIWFIIAPEINIRAVCAPSPRVYSICTEILSFAKVLIDRHKWRKQKP